MKGDTEEPEGEPTVVSGERTDLGESSKDSAIVSVDREREITDPDLSLQTAVTSLPTSSTKPESSQAQSITVVPLPPPPPSDDPDEEKDGAECDDGEKEKEDVSEDEKEMNIWQKLIYWFTIIYLFIESCVISATAKLNHVSRDYRYVSRRLSVEKRALKLLFEMEEAEGGLSALPSSQLIGCLRVCAGISYDSEWKKTTLEKISKASVPQMHRVESSLSFKVKRGSDDKVLQKKSSPGDSVE